MDATQPTERRSAAGAWTLALVVLLLLGASALVSACGGTSTTTSNSPSPSPSKVAASVAASPSATPLPKGAGRGTIAFTKVTEDSPVTEASMVSFDIYVVRSDGRGLRRLAAHARGPAWSPDGSRIGFLSGGAVWAMKADGSHQRQVTAANLGVTELAWSPDGGRIAMTLRAASHVGLAVMNADGSGFRRLFWERDLVSYDNPVWAPDGRIFFARRDESDLREISSVKPDGSGLTVVSAAWEDSFSLSHDGKWLLIFDSGQRYAVRMAADGRGREQVVLSKEMWEKYLRGAAHWPIGSSWSPEGRWIAVATCGVPTMGLASSGLWVVKSDGYYDPLPLSGAGMKVFDPAWQPR